MQSESKQPQLQSSLIQANIIVLQNGLLDIALGIKAILDAPKFSLEDFKKLTAQFNQHVAPKLNHKPFKHLFPLSQQLRLIIKELVNHQEKYDKAKVSNAVDIFIAKTNSIIKELANLSKSPAYVAKLVSIREQADKIFSHYDPKNKKYKTKRKESMQMLLNSFDQLNTGKINLEQLEETINKAITDFLGTKHGVLFKTKYTPLQFEALDHTHEYAYFLKILRDGIVTVKQNILDEIAKAVSQSKEQKEMKSAVDFKRT